MGQLLSGSCCCGKVKFTVEDDFSKFYFCHCEQCKKLTGTAHAAYLFTRPYNITWVAGTQNILRYDDPERSFTKAFCNHCGSSLPFISQSEQFLIVPAGSLNEEPSKKPDAQIFYNELAEWQKHGVNVKKEDGFPT